MSNLEIYELEQSERWTDVLAHIPQHDFYHLPQYHALAEQRREGRACLYVYCEADYCLALPLLLRPIADVPGLGKAGQTWMDATSVYGYVGPVASHTELPSEVIGRFQDALTTALVEQRVVSLFSRLHPLLAQADLLTGLGQCVPLGSTVSIDLTLPADVRRARYRRNHRSDIDKLRRLGVHCRLDTTWDHLTEFVEIYGETMCRVCATQSYCFDLAYFQRLVSLLGDEMQLFVCQLEGEIICGGLVSFCCEIVQYHLCGSRSAYRRLAPNKLMTDVMCEWAAEQGARVFHLGGGVGARRDSLFHYKSGFSDRVHDFDVWQWVLLPEVYAQLCTEQARRNREHCLQPTSSDFFPRYRGCTDRS